MTIGKDHIIERAGRKMVLYAGLLNEAHEMGLKRISTTLIQIPTAENGNVAIVAAEVEMKDGGIFSGIGDASPENVNKMVAKALIRMGETRAKARALRDAINIDMVAADEVPEDEEPAAGNVREYRTRQEPPVARPQPQAQGNGNSKPQTEGERERKRKEALLNRLDEVIIDAVRRLDTNPVAVQHRALEAAGLPTDCDLSMLDADMLAEVGRTVVALT